MARKGKTNKKGKTTHSKTTNPTEVTGSGRAGRSNAALIIGGGIAGIQAALDLAESGVVTYIVERSPSIGGRMAQLDKTFPTNDCAMCILSPKLVTVARHPNIRLITNSEITKVTGSAGNFKVKVKKYPRYIDENKCVGCGECATKCPKKVTNEFDLGLSMRKAIYLPFPQAVPLVYSIDPDNCIYLQKGKCGVCAKVCKAEAIDYDQKEEDIDLDIGAIIVSTGYEQYEPNALEELGYGIYKNVITGLEFERMLNASGPTQGKVVKISDNKPPKNILFIQCVGSRDKHRAQEYCSRICCMYAIKEAMISKEHQPELKDIKILNMEIRAYGKGFEEYYHRALAEGIEFIQGRHAEISENKKTHELSVRIENVEQSKIQNVNTDLVVLSSAVVPNKTNKRLAEILGIDLDKHGFFNEVSSASNTEVITDEFCSVTSTRPGIFLSGCAQGPKDIPDSVAQGSAAAARAGKYLARTKLEPVKPKPPHKIMADEKPELEEEPRIGVFVCRCGINIGGVLDVPELVKYSKTLQNVVFATENLYTCSDDTQTLIQGIIKEHKLNRVVIASCTPRTHEPLFRDTCSRAGLNPYLFEMANIRDQCSWVHLNEPEKGTEKAKDLLRMAVARAQKLKPLPILSTPITGSALVVGGGIAGMQCAIDLAAQGIDTNLIELQPELGGRLNQLNSYAPSNIAPKKVIDQKVKELQKTGVKLYTNSKIADIQGYVGNFDVTIETGEKGKKTKGNKKQVDLNTGAIVIAIGSELYEPKMNNEYGFGKYSNVISNLDLEEHLKNKKIGKDKRDIIFIQCVGAREHHKKDGNQACSRYCCQTTLHQAVGLRKQGKNVTILHKGIRAFSKYAEELYYEAGALGVTFVQFPEGSPPKVTKKGSTIEVYDVTLNRGLHLHSDLIVLTLAMIPNQKQTELLQNWLKIPRSSDGFFLELHPKLGPVETNTVGIYLCGCAQGPKDITDSLNQASGAAAKVAALLSNKELEVEPIVACVDEQLCWGCGKCEELCPFGAAQVTVTTEGVKRSSVNSALCKGCGVCASNCPTGAISIMHYTNEQISCMIKAFGEVTI